MYGSLPVFGSVCYLQILPEKKTNFHWKEVKGKKITSMNVFVEDVTKRETIGLLLSRFQQHHPSPLLAAKWHSPSPSTPSPISYNLPPPPPQLSAVPSPCPLIWSQTHLTVCSIYISHWVIWSLLKSHWVECVWSIGCVFFWQSLCRRQSHPRNQWVECMWFIKSLYYGCVSLQETKPFKKPETELTASALKKKIQNTQEIKTTLFN